MSVLYSDPKHLAVATDTHVVLSEHVSVGGGLTVSATIMFTWDEFAGVARGYEAEHLRREVARG